MAMPDTVVVCRPWQVAEAAIVLSCAPPGAVPALVAIAPPPITEDEYRSRYDAYVQARNERDELTGAPIARAAAAPAAVLAANARVAALAERLTEYRTWRRRQRLMASLIGTLAPRRALMLFAPEPADIAPLEALPVSRIGDRRFPTLPPGVEQLCLSGLALDSLTDAAWQAWDRSGPPGRGQDVGRQRRMAGSRPAWP